MNFRLSFFLLILLWGGSSAMASMKYSENSPQRGVPRAVVNQFISDVLPELLFSIGSGETACDEATGVPFYLLPEPYVKQNDLLYVNCGTVTVKNLDQRETLKERAQQYATEFEHVYFYNGVYITMFEVVPTAVAGGPDPRTLAPAYAMPVYPLVPERVPFASYSRSGRFSKTIHSICASILENRLGR